jgi:hypothetical protein
MLNFLQIFDNFCFEFFHSGTVIVKKLRKEVKLETIAKNLGGQCSIPGLF